MANGNKPPTDAESHWTASDWKYYFDERAGILEFDGQLNRQDAEQKAFDCVVVEWLNANPCSNSDNDKCAHCGLSLGQIGTDLVPFLNGGGHIWVHHDCHPDWMANRRMRAEKALGAMGILIP